MALGSKEKIIKAAIKVFAAKGYDGASMDEIAQAARLTKPMIYYHFKNKKSLYLYLLESHVERFYSRLQDILHAPRDHRQILSMLIDYYDESFRTNPEMLQLFQRETAGNGMFLKFLTGNYLLKIHEQMAAFFRDGARAGVFRTSLNYDMCPHTLAASLMFNFSMERIIQQVSKSADENFFTTKALHAHIMNLFIVEDGGDERRQV